MSPSATMTICAAAMLRVGKLLVICDKCFEFEIDWSGHTYELCVTLIFRDFFGAGAGSKLVMRWYSSKRKATRSASEA